MHISNSICIASMKAEHIKFLTLLVCAWSKLEGSEQSTRKYHGKTGVVGVEGAEQSGWKGRSSQGGRG